MRTLCLNDPSIIAASNSSATLTDSSSNAYSISTTSISRSTSIKKIGTAAIQFDRNPSIVTLNTAFTSITGFSTRNNWTVEAWLYLFFAPSDIADPSFGQLLFSNNGSLSSIRFTSSNQVFVQGNQTDSSATFSMGTPIVNEWFHLAVVGDIDEDEVTVWINGTQIGAPQSITNPRMSITEIGGTNGTLSGCTPFIGLMDEIRLTRGTVRYTSSFTPSTTAFTSDASTQYLIHCD